MKYKKEVEKINSYYKSELADEDQPPTKCLPVRQNLEKLRKPSWNCPYYSTWSAWSGCQHQEIKCGIGKRSRTRSCKLQTNRIETVPEFMCESYKSGPYSTSFRSDDICETKCKQKWTGYQLSHVIICFIISKNV